MDVLAADLALVIVAQMYRPVMVGAIGIAFVAAKVLMVMANYWQHSVAWAMRPMGMEVQMYMTVVGAAVVVMMQVVMAIEQLYQLVKAALYSHQPPVLGLQ